jgi:hypothetical protein
MQCPAQKDIPNTSVVTQQACTAAGQCICKSVRQSLQQSACECVFTSALSKYQRVPHIAHRRPCSLLVKHRTALLFTVCWNAACFCVCPCIDSMEDYKLPR